MRNACLALGATMLSHSAAATVQTVTYTFPETPGVSLLFGHFGGDEPVTGFIVQTRVFLSFAPEPGIDAANFFSGFSVPILPRPGFDTELIILGADIGGSGDQPQTFQLTTRAHNGEIRPGRFGWEIRAADDSLPLRGLIRPGSVIEFDIVVPAPASLALFGLAGIVRRRRRA